MQDDDDDVSYGICPILFFSLVFYTYICVDFSVVVVTIRG